MVVAMRLSALGVLSQPVGSSSLSLGHGSPGLQLTCRDRRPCRLSTPRSVPAASKDSEARASLPGKQPEELSAVTVGGETLTELSTSDGTGTLAVPLSGVVLPEGLGVKEQQKRLWFAAVKPPMYTVALIPVLVRKPGAHQDLLQPLSALQF